MSCFQIRPDGTATIVAALLWAVVPCARSGSPFLSDPIPVTHWGSDEGLSPGQVMTMLQTQDGYLWFGSDGGLMRFDGVNCEVYDTRNTPEMTVNVVGTLFEDGQKRLWAGLNGAGGGLLCRTEDGRFKFYGKADGLENERVRTLTEDSDGRLWVGTDGGGLYQFENGKLHAFRGNTNLPSQFISKLIPAVGGGIWVGGNARLTRVQNGVVMADLSDEGDLPSDTTTLLGDSTGVVWVGGNTGLYRLEGRKFSKVDGADGPSCCVQALCFGVDGRLWIGTTRGLYRMEGNDFYRTTTEQGLSGNLVNAIYRDREGSIWVASDVPGVDQIRFTRFSSLSTRQGISHPITTSIFEDDRGDMWIGSHQGINHYSKGVVNHWTARDGLAANLVFTACQDQQGRIWVGTVNGLNRLDEGKIHGFGQQADLPSPVTWCLYRGRDGTVWAGTRRGVVRIREERFETYNHNNAGLSHDDVRAICEDGAGNLWVGTSYGLNRFENGRFVSFFEAATNRPFNAVIALHADQEGNLWIGTMEQGLARYRDGKFTSYTRDEGLYDNLIYAILEDDEDNLWMSCNRGIYRVNKAELNAVAEGRAKRVNCTVFGKADGLLSTECNGTVQPAAWKSRDGRLWFATTKGVAVADPGHHRRNEMPPPVSIAAVLLDQNQFAPTNGITVTPQTRSIEFRFSAQSFIAPELVRFKYYLEGLNTHWLPATPERSVHYSYLPPGAYRFRVTACNNDGVWNEAGASLRFVVQPPWWRSLWFGAVAIAAFVGLIGGGARVMTRRRYRKHLAELARQHELEQERSRIARDMHDVLGSELVKISMLGEFAEAECDAPQTLRPRLQKMIRTARDAVRGMDEIVWAVNPKNDTLENLANYLCQFASEHFELTTTRLHLEIPPNLPETPLRAELRHDLFLVVKEALNNALKHAHASDVWLRLKATEGSLHINVEDNGTGILTKSNGRQGNGIPNMRNRVVPHGGELEIANREGSGTRVAIRLPLK